MTKALKSLLLVALLINASSVFSQSLVEQIKARAGEISELKALLNNPDSAVRIAAIDVMQNSDDLAMREMGFNAGINSSDEAVVALSLRNKFKEIKNFNVQLSLSSDASDELKKAYNELGGQMGFLIKTYDVQTASFTNTSTYNGNVKTSTISGMVLQLQSYYSNGTFVLNDELIFVGELSFDGQRIPGSIRLF